MADFCKCGSLVVRGNCSNKSCDRHGKSLVDPATYGQIDLINSLKEQLGDDREIDFETLTKLEASRLIDELFEAKETGE